jgi:hypothetical protein
MNQPRRFRVAFSFPGPKRDYVQQIAEALAVRFGEEALLYDRFHTAEFADADLAFKLPALYRDQADLIVVVLSGEYAQRQWCGLEWRAIYAHIMAGHSKNVMLFRADDAPIRGLYGLEGFALVDAFQPADAARLILQRLAINEGRPRDFYLDGGHRPAAGDSPVITPSRLPRRHEHSVFKGREGTLAALDALWADVLGERSDRARIVSLVAIGGAGKTTVVARWKDRLLAQAEHGGVERYFDWSFYSQGTRRVEDTAAAHTAGDATVFVAAALKFFGDAGDQDLADSPAPAWDKGERLAELVARRRALLVLDGLEPLQHPPGPQAGELRDEALRALLAGLTQHNRGLCVVTSRERIADLAGTESPTESPFAPRKGEGEDVLSRSESRLTPCWNLDHLSDVAGAAVLRAHGVVGPDDELRRASREVQGHALTVSLMGRYLKLAFSPPDVARRDSFRFRAADAETQNGHAFRVFAAYERWLDSEGRHVELAILRLLGLFDRPATPDCLAALCEPPALPGLTEPLIGLSGQKWNTAVQRLHELDLIETVDWSPGKVSGYGEEEAHAEMAAGRRNQTTNLGPPQPFVSSHSSLVTGHSLDAHPLLREYFGARLAERAVAATAHGRLFEWLCASVPYWPEGRDGLLPLYQAVAHGCQAGRFEEASVGVYRDRILRGTAGSHAAYSTKKLGLLGLDLAAVACFFVEPWKQLAAELSPGDQAWLLSEAAFSLRALNRLAEAREPERVSMEMDIAKGEWTGQRYLPATSANWNSRWATSGRPRRRRRRPSRSPIAAATSSSEWASARRTPTRCTRRDESRTAAACLRRPRRCRRRGSPPTRCCTRFGVTGAATCCSPPPSGTPGKQS